MNSPLILIGCGVLTVFAAVFLYDVVKSFPDYLDYRGYGAPNWLTAFRYCFIYLALGSVGFGALMALGAVVMLCQWIINHPIL